MSDMKKYLAYITKDVRKKDALSMLKTLKKIYDSIGEDYLEISVSVIEVDYKLDLEPPFGLSEARIDQAVKYFDSVTIIGEDDEVKEKFEKLMKERAKTNLSSIAINYRKIAAGTDDPEEALDFMLKELKEEEDPSVKAEIKKGLDILNKRLWPELNTE